MAGIRVVMTLARTPILRGLVQIDLAREGKKCALKKEDDKCSRAACEPNSTMTKSAKEEE
jgi:hypothetical protein